MAKVPHHGRLQLELAALAGTAGASGAGGRWFGRNPTATCRVSVQKEFGRVYITSLSLSLSLQVNIYIYMCLHTHTHTLLLLSSPSS